MGSRADRDRLRDWSHERLIEAAGSLLVDYQAGLRPLDELDALWAKVIIELERRGSSFYAAQLEGHLIWVEPFD